MLSQEIKGLIMSGINHTLKASKHVSFPAHDASSDSIKIEHALIESPHAKISQRKIFNTIELDRDHRAHLRANAQPDRSKIVLSDLRSVFSDLNVVGSRKCVMRVSLGLRHNDT